MSYSLLVPATAFMPQTW